MGLTRYAVYREQLVGFVEAAGQIPAHTAACAEYERAGRIIRVQPAGCSDSDDRIDRETEKFGHWKAENNDAEQDGS